MSPRRQYPNVAKNKNVQIHLFLINNPLGESTYWPMRSLNDVGINNNQQNHDL